MLITLLKRSIIIFFFPQHLESHLRACNIQKEAVEDLPWKRRCNFQQLSFQTIFIVIYFLFILFPWWETKMCTYKQNSPAIWLCLTLLQSETLGYIQLTQSTLLQVRISFNSSVSYNRVAAASHCEVLPWKGGTGRGLLQEPIFPESVSTPDSHRPATATQCSWETPWRQNKFKGKFFLGYCQ